MKINKKINEFLKTHLTQKGLNYILSNQEEAFDILNTQLGINKSDFKSLVKEIQNENLNKILRKENK